MNIKPIVSNSIEIENEGVKIKVHCGSEGIEVSSECKIQYPMKFKVGDLVSEKTVLFALESKTEGVKK